MKIGVLLILPILVVIISGLIRIKSGPGWIGYKYDPDYAYLLNSLNITQGKIPGHVDHPGTPLQLAGAAVITSVHLTRPDNLVADVLTHPEVYLGAVNRFLLFLVFVSMYGVGYLTFRLTGNIWTGLLLQLTPLLSAQALLDLHRVAPEPVLLVTSLWFGYLVLRLFWSNQKDNIPETFWLGVITGLAAATKLNALPLVSMPLLMLSWRSRWVYLLTTAASFIVLTLPIIGEYPKVMAWVYQLSVHAGSYGQGSATVTNFGTFVTNFTRIAVNEPFLIIIAIWSLILLTRNEAPARLRPGFFAKRDKYVLGLAVYLGLSLFLGSKLHYLRYLVPTLGMLGAGTVLLLMQVKNKTVLVMLCILIAVVNMTKAVMAITADNVNIIEAEEIKQLVAEKYPDYQIVMYYGASNPLAALGFGDRYANFEYALKLAQMWPQTYYYNLGAPLPELRGNPILFQGVPFVGAHAGLKPDLDLIDVYGGQAETIYLYNGN